MRKNDAGRIGLSDVKFIPKNIEWEGSFKVTSFNSQSLWYFFWIFLKKINRCKRKHCLTARQTRVPRTLATGGKFLYRIVRETNFTVSVTAWWPGWPGRPAATSTGSGDIIPRIISNHGLTWVLYLKIVLQQKRSKDFFLSRVFYITKVKYHASPWPIIYLY